MKGLVASVVVLAVGLIPAVPQVRAAMMAGGDVKKELQTAIFHASELAQRGNSVQASKLHIQHVINCLEGPGGSNFKQEAGFPCQGQGNGIIPDLKAAAAGKTPGADAALQQAMLAENLAVQAEGKNDINEVQPWAKVVADHLKAALDALGS
jgi:hypothetical protein